MIYVCAFFVPPLALRLIGRPFAVIAGGFLWRLGLLAGHSTCGIGYLLSVACMVHTVGAVIDLRQANLFRSLRDQ